LKLGQSGEFEVERVDTEEGHHIDNVEEEPDDQHQDVVGKNHVVDDA